MIDVGEVALRAGADVVQQHAARRLRRDDGPVRSSVGLPAPESVNGRPAVTARATELHEQRLPLRAQIRQRRPCSVWVASVDGGTGAGIAWLTKAASASSNVFCDGLSMLKWPPCSTLIVRQ